MWLTKPVLPVERLWTNAQWRSRPAHRVTITPTIITTTLTIITTTRRRTAA